MFGLAPIYGTRLTPTPTTDHSVIGNIHNYLGYSKFKQAALFAVAFNTDQKGIDSIRTAFEELDQEGLGVITPGEFYDVMKENGVGDEEINEMYDKLDPTHQHQVNCKSPRSEEHLLIQSKTQRHIPIYAFNVVMMPSIAGEDTTFIAIVARRRCTIPL